MTRPIDVPRLLLAAPASGAGKTTVAAALMRVLRDRGLRVAPFKVGPDYIDPTHHTAAAGRASRNLDGWMLPHDTLRALFRRATTGTCAADIAVLEGVMGLFDGRVATTDEGSTAQMARLLGVPVVLVLAGERSLDLDRLATRAGETLDIDALLALARSAPALPVGPDPRPRPVARTRAVIAVARDAAFDFYYEDNLDLLRDLGVELHVFSPLEDPTLPEGAGALYLGGGYPELHAGRLAANAAMREAVRRFAASGRPIYAECGGAMYLSEALVDARGTRYPMVGVVPGTSVMQPRLTLGYREVVALEDSPLARRGWTVLGHEFHHSILQQPPERTAYRRADGGEREGTIGGPAGNVLASYIHVHFGADPALAERLIQRAES